MKFTQNEPHVSANLFADLFHVIFFLKFLLDVWRYIFYFRSFYCFIFFLKKFGASNKTAMKLPQKNLQKLTNPHKNLDDNKKMYDSKNATTIPGSSILIFS